jgi:shikimate dehydrogenase
MAILNKDMTMCISIAARPSNVGTRFHNYLYEQLGLNWIYKGFAVDDAIGAVQGVRALKIRGAAVSMPHKEKVIPLLDELDQSAAAIEAVNTIVNSNGYLKGYNTDYQAVIEAINKRDIATDSKVAVRGSGGMAKAVVAAFKNSGFRDLVIYSRNRNTGEAIATKYGFQWCDESYLEQSSHADILVNVTPLGMEGGNEGELSFPVEKIQSASLILEAIAVPAETPLVAIAREHKKEIITGVEIMASQAAIQFELYTGITLSANLIASATAFSRLQ